MAIYTASASNYVDFGTAAQYTLPGSMTITGWYYTASTSTADRRILTKWSQATNGYGYILGIASRKLMIVLGRSSSAYNAFVGTTTLATSTWYQICGRFNNDTKYVDIFLNGVSDMSSTSWNYTIYDNSAIPLRLGVQSAGATIQVPALGNMFDVRLYNRALTDAEIKTIYGAQGKDAILNGLVLRTAILDGANAASLSGATIYDHSQYKNNVTATGAPTAYGDPFGTVRRQIAA